jgi:thiamine monophosphate kinase
VDETAARRRALTGGEDYVLCFTLPPGIPLPARCREIGRVESGSGVSCDQEFEVDGYRHF